MTTRPVAKAFYFRARMADGTISAGQLAATSQQDALLQLRRAGAQPFKIQSRPITQSWLLREVGFGGGKKLSVGECEQFCRDLALLLVAGLELPDAMASILAATRKQTKLWQFATALAQRLQLGQKFSDAIEQSGFALPQDFVPVIRAGEEAGAVPAALQALGDSLSDRGKLSRTIAAALAYPSFLLVVVILMLCVMAAFVAPALGRVFLSMNRPVPGIISFLWGTSSLVEANPLAVICVLAAFVLGVLLLIGSPVGRNSIRYLASHLPLIGTAMAWSATARFASALRLSVMTNVPLGVALPRALQATALIDARRTERAAQQLRRGARLVETLSGLNMLPAKAMHLIEIGERSGRLAEVLLAILEEAKSQAERRTAMLAALLGPIMIVLVGAIVGTVVFSVFSALMEINNLTT